jgi:hypothetical protein
MVAGVLRLLCCLLAGCATSSVPYVDKSSASVLVLRGYFESGKLHRWAAGCSGPAELMEVINCAPGPQSVATFVVEQTLVGATAPKRLRVHFGYAEGWPELKLGQRHQYLAAVLSDGQVNELGGAARVARTIDGRWAIPITFAEDSYLFPCSTYDVEPALLRFQEPRPREAIADLVFTQYEVVDLIDDLKGNDSYSLEGSYVYANKGVLLEYVAAAYGSKPATKFAGECH